MFMESPTAYAGVSSVPRAVDTRRREGARLALPIWLSSGVTLFALIASAAGLFIPGVYRDAPTWAAQARGTDLVTLTVAVPSLAISMLLTARGSRRAGVVWLGVLGYSLYMYVISAFDVVFNPLFLVYLAVLSLSLFALVALLIRLDADEVQAHFDRGLPRRTTGGYLVGLATLFLLAWLRDIIPAIVRGNSPDSLNGTTLPTNPVHVLDLSVLLPLAALSGVWLWQRRPWGYLLAGALLTTLTIVGTSVVSGIVFERLDDATVSLAALPLLIVVTLAGLGLLVIYLRHLKSAAAVSGVDS
jgi:hypothetical protein